MSRTARCASCRRPMAADHDTFPFCSQRCRAVDLGSWLGEAYRLPDGPDPERESAALQHLLEGHEDEWPIA